MAFKTHVFLAFGIASVSQAIRFLKAQTTSDFKIELSALINLGSRVFLAFIWLIFPGDQISSIDSLRAYGARL